VVTRATDVVEIVGDSVDVSIYTRVRHNDNKNNAYVFSWMLSSGILKKSGDEEMKR
jgi:hypothetical protein